METLRHDRRAAARARARCVAATIVGLVPTMGALHAGHEALFGAARAECDVVVASLFVNPAQFADAGRLRRVSARPRRATSASPPTRGVDVALRAVGRRALPARLRDLGRAGRRRRGARGRAPPRPFPRRRDRLREAVHDRPARSVAYFGRKDAQQVAVVKQVVRDLDLELEIRVVPTVRDDDGLALSSRNAPLSADASARGRSRSRARSRRATRRERARCSPRPGSSPTTSPSPTSTGRPSRSPPAIGSTRLIDNVLLEGDSR